MIQNSNFKAYQMARASFLSLSVEPNASTTLVEQLCHQMRSMIEDGRLPKDTRLPSTRGLAMELGISRSSVVTAYEQLVAEGCIQASDRSGFRTCDVRPQPMGAALFVEGEVQPEQPSLPLHLAPGAPDMELFPYRAWATCIARVARETPEAFVDPTDPFGDPVLRRLIAAYLADWRGIQTSASNICIIASTSDAIELILKTLCPSPSIVALEDPGYLPIRRTVASLGHLPVWMTVDDYGAVPNALETTGASTCILTPSHHFPLGRVMPLARRQAFLATAKETGAWIIEDDYDSEFRFEGLPIPAMKSRDVEDSVFYVGGFSKVFANTIRIAYLIVPTPMRGKVQETLRAFGSKASRMPQRPLARFLESGEFYKHVRRMRRIYNGRRRYFLKSVRDQFEDHVGVFDSKTGMHVPLIFRKSVDDIAIAKNLRHLGIGATALSSCFFDGGQFGLVLGYSSQTERKNDDALNAIYNILEQHL